MNAKISEFRDGIFALRTRRFGTVAELMIQHLINASKGKNQFHDLYDEAEGKRIEVKFSTVMKANDAKINDKNIIEQCAKATLAKRAMRTDEIKENDFDCNIQQVKRKEFDLLYYGLFFADKIAIFKIDSSDILNCFGYSDFQHKGNEGEGQFHLNPLSIDYHLNNHFVEWLSYEDLYNLFTP
ncbi:hypothetical protein [Desulfitobacterium metallireducens]|uniref:Uncharacterized protein n=1 Tax=Desulfitobacterium metallireducens DSM 15288 TaxID=871968 RepID=W0EGT2_9FIRM|nr:hypothetical protein [Desulfitobacterium metallireducens]AHF08703.1 hypothetical protein DESME_15050 [Desulfitobacterium metallireducens DSM 15288]